MLRNIGDEVLACQLRATGSRCAGVIDLVHRRSEYGFIARDADKLLIVIRCSRVTAITIHKEILVRKLFIQCA
jgi:hypothetical protein